MAHRHSRSQLRDEQMPVKNASATKAERAVIAIQHERRPILRVRELLAVSQRTASSVHGVLSSLTLREGCVEVMKERGR